MRTLTRFILLLAVAGCTWAEASETNAPPIRLRPTIDESDLYNAMVEAVQQAQGLTSNPGPYDLVVTPTMLDETFDRLSALIRETHGVTVTLRLRYPSGKP